MKKSFILGLVILPIAGLFMTTCVYQSLLLYKFEVTLDKTEARVGDTVTATVTWVRKNKGNIEVELPNWIAAQGGKNVEDILYVVFSNKDEDNFNWYDVTSSYYQENVKRPKIVIKEGEVIKKKFVHTIAFVEDLYVSAGFFYLDRDSDKNSIGMQFSFMAETIKVLEGEPK